MQPSALLHHLLLQLEWRSVRSSAMPLQQRVLLLMPRLHLAGM